MYVKAVAVLSSFHTIATLPFRAHTIMYNTENFFFICLPTNVSMFPLFYLVRVSSSARWYWENGIASISDNLRYNKKISRCLCKYLIPFSERKGYMAKIRVKKSIKFVCLSVCLSVCPGQKNILLLNEYCWSLTVEP